LKISDLVYTAKFGYLFLDNCHFGYITKLEKKNPKKDTGEKLARLPARYLCGNQRLKNICTEFSFPNKISVMKYSR
jgi:hypothetical protein